jgi:hypothetical protein
MAYTEHIPASVGSRDRLFMKVTGNLWGPGCSQAESNGGFMNRERVLNNIDLLEEDSSCTPQLPGGLADADGLEWARQQKQARIGRATGSKHITNQGALKILRKNATTSIQLDTDQRFPKLTFADFVKEKFVPEHVAFKKKAGRMHYAAMLKHIITPDEVERAFQINGVCSTSKLQADSDWPYLNNLPLHEVHPDNLQRLILAAVNQGYSIQTVVHIRNVIGAIFGDNPARLVKLPERTRRSMPTLTLNQVRDVFGLMRYPEREMMLIAILTGMNVTEICGLRWKCVNLTGAGSGDDGDAIPPISIAIKNQLYRGECAEVRECRIRNLAIPELLLPILLRLRARPNYIGPDDFVLVSRSGTPVNPINITARRLRPIANELQIPWLSWSLLRKAHNSLQAEFGTEFEYLLAKMVHSDSKERFGGDHPGN